MYQRSLKHSYIVILVRVPERERNSIGNVQEALKRVDPAHIYNRLDDLHMTVKALRWLDIDFDREKLQRMIEIARTIASQTAPLEISLDGLKVFPDAIYVMVREGAQGVKALNMALSKGLTGYIPEGNNDGNRMVPHVTLATFDSVDTSSVQHATAAYESTHFGKVTIKELIIADVTLYKYWGPPHEQRGAFHELARLALGNSR